MDADSASDSVLYGNYISVNHGGVSGTTHGLNSVVYPSDTGDVYGIKSYVNRNGTTGAVYAGYFDTGSNSSGNYVYAGYFVGTLHVNGYLSKSGGSFKIDHPLDPENKYLQHSFVESPDMMNVYNGNVFLDNENEAWVELPKYFESLNRDFRYQLTCLGGFAQVYIAEKVFDNRFKIAGGQANMEVSWQVTGVRQDAWAEANRIEVEVDKDEKERGSYLTPEVFGFDETRSVEYTHHPEMMLERIKKEKNHREKKRTDSRL